MPYSAQTALLCLTPCHQESRVTHPSSRSASALVCVSIHLRSASVLTKLMKPTCSCVHLQAAARPRSTRSLVRKSHKRQQQHHLQSRVLPNQARVPLLLVLLSRRSPPRRPPVSVQLDASLLRHVLTFATDPILKRLLQTITSPFARFDSAQVIQCMPLMSLFGADLLQSTRCRRRCRIPFLLGFLRWGRPQDACQFLLLLEALPSQSARTVCPTVQCISCGCAPVPCVQFSPSAAGLCQPCRLSGPSVPLSLYLFLSRQRPTEPSQQKDQTIWRRCRFPPARDLFARPRRHRSTTTR